MTLPLLPIPTIVAIGSQSSGKSSLLETILQCENILPRGKEICTRCPIIVESRKTKATTHKDTDISIKIQNSQVKRTEIIQRIQNEMQKITIHEWKKQVHENQFQLDSNGVNIEGTNSKIEDSGSSLSQQPPPINAEQIDEPRTSIDRTTISDTPINISISGPDMMDLTIIDLPGITKIPIGAQPTDIEARIKRLILNYIENPNAIILAVTPANQDVANSEGLKMAKQVDPLGLRTVGVLTKLDLMDYGTNALSILQNKTVPLKLGWIPVVCRSQQDIIDNVTLDEGKLKEQRFFEGVETRLDADSDGFGLKGGLGRSGGVYKCLNGQWGAGYLAQRLNQILQDRLKQQMPTIRRQITQAMSEINMKLAALGSASALNGPGPLILRLITQYCNAFSSGIMGWGFTESYEELCGGAKIAQVFKMTFPALLDGLFNIQALTPSSIRTALQNCTGPRQSVFLPELAFEVLVKPQIRNFSYPCRSVVTDVAREMEAVALNISTTELQKYPNLKRSVQDITLNLLKERIPITQQYVQSMIDIQVGYINTSHPDFLAATSLFESVGREVERKRRERAEEGWGMMGRDLVTPFPDRRGRAPDTTTRAGGMVRDASVGSVASTRTSYGPTEGIDHMRNVHNVDKQKRRESNMFSDGKSLPQAFSSMSLPSGSRVISSVSDEEPEIRLIRSLVTAYLQVTRRTIQDTVPKAIMHLFVNHCCDELQNKLISELYKESHFGTLIEEDPWVREERDKLNASLQSFEAAIDTLNTIS